MHRRRFAAMALALGALPLAAQGGSTSPATAGLQLREALLKAYDTCRHDKKTPPAIVAGGCDVTEVAAQFVRPGMPFDTAERLLKEAGLNLAPRGESPVLRGVYAVFGGMKLDSSWFSNTALTVTLTPDDPATYARVRQVTARIVTTWL